MHALPDCVEIRSEQHIEGSCCWQQELETYKQLENSAHLMYDASMDTGTAILVQKGLQGGKHMRCT
jgi:hypothetical protein